MLFGERPLGPDDALGDRRLRHEERPRDLLGRQAAEQAERERDARLGGEHRMAGREDKAQEVVADVVVEGRVEIRRGSLLLGFAAHGRSPRACVPAACCGVPVIDGAMFRGGHEPGARVVRDARLRPLLERGDQSVLRELLGQADVAHDPRQTGDEPGRLDPPDRVDRAMGVGSRHDDRLDHLQSVAASRGDAQLRAHVPVFWPDCACISAKPAAASLTSAGKSENSWTWRTSITSLSEAGQRDAHSIASSFDFTWIIQ